MESDDLFDRIRDGIKDSEMFYSPQANKAYSRIWDAVEKKEGKATLFWYKWVAVAAVVLLLFTSSIFLIYFKQSNTKAAALQQQAEELHLLAARQNKELNFREEKSIEHSGKFLSGNQKAETNAIADQEQGSTGRDTIYIIQTKEVVKILEPSILLEEPQIIAQAGLMLSNSLVTDEVKNELPKTPRLHFIFAENNVNDAKNPKSKKKVPGLKIRLGTTSPNESYTSSKPLSIHANF